MTCIAGIAQGGKVYMGADSISSDGYNRHISGLRKVFRVGAFLIGYTTSFRMGQILQYHLDVRQQQDGESDERYMVVAFVEAARECLKAKGYSTVDMNTESGGEFLVGYRGTLYRAGYDFHIDHYQSGLGVCGAGEQYALAALLALHDWQPEARIRRALEISAELSALVSPPFQIETLES